MKFEFVEVEVAGPLEDVTVSDRSDGLAVLLRDGGRPVGLRFVDRDSLGATELTTLAVEAAAENLLTDRLRRAFIAAWREDGHAQESQAAPPTVTVVVCTRNRADDLELCLQSIGRSLPGRGVDVLVVDNAPSDGSTCDVVARHPLVRYVCEPLAGLDVARNRALAEARGEWILFTDDDVRVDRGWVEGLLSALEEHPDAACVTGLVLPAELDTEAQVRFERNGGFGRGFVQRRWDGRRGPGGRLHPLGAGVFGAGCNMGFHVGRLRAAGGFDEALDTGPPLPGGGDLDGFYKVLDAGHALVYEPRMTVFHRHRRELDELSRQYHSWGSGFAAFLGARWADPEQRVQIARLGAWWTRYQVRRGAGAVVRRNATEVQFVLAELRGGIAGAAGGYARSRRRMERRRASLRPAGLSPYVQPIAEGEATA